MNRAVPVVALLAVAAGAAWFVFGSPPKSKVVVEDGAEASDADEAKGPSELAAGPASARTGRSGTSKPTGGSQLSGTVRREGVVIAARVEAHYVMAADGNPFSRRGGSSYFQRMMALPPSEKDAAATTRAADDGRFTIDGLGAGVYELRAETDDGARGWGSATILIDGARVEANVDVDGGGETLSGRVIHADGTPWTGLVLVDAWRGRQGGDRLGSLGASSALQTDSTGAFVAKGLKAGEVMVSAVEPGVFRVSSNAIKVPRTEPFVLTIDAALSTTKGRVVADADGSPLAGATVAAGGQGGDFSLFVAQTTTTSDGAFEVRLPSGNQSGFLISADGYAPQSRQTREFKPGESIEFRMVKVAHVVGRVTRASDETPVALASVRVTSLGERNFMASADVATTDADGRYEQGNAASGEVMVTAEAPGLVTKGIAEVKGQGFNPLATTAKPGETTTVDVTMVAGAKVSGTVTDSAGVPVRGAVIAPVAMPNDPRSGFRFDPFSAGPKAVSGADGSFVIDVLVPGRSYVLGADCAGYATCRADAFSASESVPAVVALKFAARRMADISVLDDVTGTGIAGARVSATGTAPMGGFVRSVASGSSGTTGSDGRVRLGPLEAGELRLDVQSDDHVRNDFGGNDSPKLLADETSAVVRLRRGLPIAGRVTMPDGSPAVGASVQIEHDGSSARGWVQPVTTGADGTFRMRGVLAGSVKLTATASKDRKVFVANAAVTVGSEDVSLALVEGAGGRGNSLAQLVVRVLDADGKAVPSASAMIRSKGSTSSTSVTNGHVSLGMVAGESATILIWAAKGRDGVALNLAPFRREIDGKETDIEVKLSPGLSIEGVVRGPDGVGMKGVQVSALPKSKDSTAGDSFARQRGYRQQSTARTDATGAFRLNGLTDEDYVLSVEAAAEFAPYDGSTVRGGAKGVDVALKAGISVVVTVLDAAGKPIAGATVRAQGTTADDGGGRYRPPGGTTTDATGVVRLAGLGSGLVYRLDVQAPEYLAFDQSPWTPTETTVRLQRAMTVSGIVKDKAGKPVALANIQWTNDRAGDSWDSVQSRVDGRFTLTNVGAGDVYLRAVLGWNVQPEDAEPVRVQAGAKDVVLTLDVGLELVVKIENWPADGPTWHVPTLTVEGKSARQIGAGDQRVAADGVVKFRGLRDDETYSLWIPTIPGGLSCHATGLRAGAGEVRVRLSPGKAITGRITVPVGADNVQVSASGAGIGVAGKVEADGRFTIEGLPDGAYGVHAFAQKDGAWWSATGKASAGGSVDLELKKP